MRSTRLTSPLSEAPVARGPALVFRTGETIKESGIYRVHHNQHRLPHEVTLLQGQDFPRCTRCDDGVSFELVLAAPFRIYLNELPVADDEATAP